MLVVLYLSIFYVIIVFVHIPILCVLEPLLYLSPIIISAAYLSLLERMILATVQKRLGPSFTGAAVGILQPLADGLKLVIKETCEPAKINRFYFVLAPMYTFSISLLLYTTLPLDPYLDFFVNLKYSLFLSVGLLSIGHHGVLFGSMFSNNKVAVISAIRAVVLSISHGLSTFLTMLGTVLMCGSLNVKEILLKQSTTGSLLIALSPLAILYIIALLSESQKVPFDVVEAEAETASGFMIEYSGINYAFLALSEYITVICSAQLFIILFTSVHYIEATFLKLGLLLFIFLLARSSLPNFRFDQASFIQWKYILPLSLCSLLLSMTFSTIFF